MQGIFAHENYSKAGKIYIDQTAYLKKVLLRFGMIKSQFAATPLPQGYKPLDNANPPDPTIRSKFQSVIGSLLYIMLGTCPDIAYKAISIRCESFARTSR